MRAMALTGRTLECFDRASREGKGSLDSVAYPAYWIARRRSEANGSSRAAASGD
jgi:hypothetical protein